MSAPPTIPLAEAERCDSVTSAHPNMLGFGFARQRKHLSVETAPAPGECDVAVLSARLKGINKDARQQHQSDDQGGHGQ